MSYIVFDLEFNQCYDPTDENKIITNSLCPFEIIQIGAIKLDEYLNNINYFDRLIKPTVYPYIHPFVRELTGIKDEDLIKSDDFSIIIKNFFEFAKSKDSIFIVWGTTDIKEIVRNMKFHKINIDSLEIRYIDLQKIISKKLKCPKGIKIGLSKALEIYNIELDKDLHNAFNDAYYTAEVFKKVYNSNIKPSIYNFKIYNSKSTSNKLNIDYDKLFSQFEKMYSKSLTTTEKEMIKLAYIMGKTNQFKK
ncbi:3'-5' exonuclease [Clostridium septicum]|uniref:Exonuclease n=1 Tax=Clostridium septicum TaxID=1504 RepID=A0A9N7JJG7_CLOSE|nr:3'-5' exonuclease [Clostridium septicum]AYE33024.1 exonuclease [Clostridium septicum]MDU1313417.1 3'-5' exonuclease [Clostridium septicum]QAS61193.1 exonuclease domain-containing protein [Clostridium septicum]UEC19459.1 exonuclease domain-containing protein [Clostridium septicum]USR99588.1 exonuclease domain-containing protein [Clostridium septicum]